MGTGTFGGLGTDAPHIHNFVRASGKNRGSITQIENPRDGSELMMMGETNGNQV